MKRAIGTRMKFKAASSIAGGLSQASGPGVPQVPFPTRRSAAPLPRADAWQPPPARRTIVTDATPRILDTMPTTPVVAEHLRFQTIGLCEANMKDLHAKVVSALAQAGPGEHVLTTWKSPSADEVERAVNEHARRCRAS